MVYDSADFVGDAVADESAPREIRTNDLADAIELNAWAKEQWAASGIVDYEVTIVPDIDEVVSDVVIADSYEVEVRDGVITRVSPEDVFSSELKQFILPAYFDEIANALQNELEILATYNPKNGFILRTEQFFAGGYVATVRFLDFREASS